MRVLGIDPGFGRTGYGVIDAVTGRQKALEYGCIETLPTDDMGRRLHDIFTAVQEIIEKYHPDVMAVEQLFFNRNVTTAFKASEARGVVVLAAMRDKPHGQIVEKGHTPDYPFRPDQNQSMKQGFLLR